MHGPKDPPHIRARQVAQATSDDFVELIRIAQYDPRHDLRFSNWSDISFNGLDLRGFDFTGSRLVGCDFAGAQIKGARFEAADIKGANLKSAKDWAAYVKAWTPPEAPVELRHLRDGAEFQDAPKAPRMLVMPQGEFLMGSNVSEASLEEDDQADEDEIVPGQGKRPMQIGRRFALGRYPVTFEEYDLFLAATRAQRKRGKNEAKDKGWGRGQRPAINVSWDDAQAYCHWLNQLTGLRGEVRYRLPLEAEWEYACRAGTATRRWWGDSWEPALANGALSFEGRKTSPVGHYGANPWGLYDMIGNVFEWCADHYAENISMLPDDGTAYEASDGGSSRVLRGGSWSGRPRDLRSAYRLSLLPVVRSNSIGFRVARTL